MSWVPLVTVEEATSETKNIYDFLQNKWGFVPNYYQALGMLGWANYFCLGAVSKAYRAVEKHACKRLRQWLCAKHKEVWPGTKRFPESSLHDVLGLVCITQRTRNFPWATS
jgi:hypothetical protein